MNLHRLAITGIGPFAGTETIDFDRLNEAGVYLLTGRTGAGKTTILDAVSYAIFGSIPRHTNGADVVSHHRKLKTTPQVELEATIGGRRVRITRSPAHERPAKVGSGTTTQAQSLRVECHSDGEWDQVTGKWSEGNEWLQERIGMTAAQFSQVVMLPQGEFARFLDAGANDRRDLLRQLFSGIDFEWLERWLREEANAARRRRDEKLEEIGNRFQRVLPVARKLAGEAEEDPLPDHTEAWPAAEWIAATARRLERAAAAREQARLEAHEAWDAASTGLRRLERRAELVRKRRAADRELAALDERREWRRRTGERIDSARRAAPVRSLAAAAAARGREESGAADELDRLKPLVEGSTPAAEVPAGGYREFRDRRRDQVQQLHDFIWKELRQRDELAGEAERLEGELRQLADTGPESAVGKAKALVERRSEAADEAARRHLELREARNRGMARELAGHLTAGEPCPVCGSPDHPAPATGEGEVPSEEDEREAARAQREAQKDQETAARELARIERESAAAAATATARLADCQRELQRLAVRERELSGEAPEVATRHEELEAEVALLDRYLEAEEHLRSARAAAVRARQEAAEEAEARGFDSVEAAVAAALEPARLGELEAQAEEFDRRLSIVENQLAEELAEVDPTETIELGPAGEAERRTSLARDEAINAAGEAQTDLTLFRSETDPVAGLYAELGPLREAADRASELDRLASGRNERKMNLSIFVLATRLRQVIEAANRHLTEMTDQRYTLIYSSDRASHGAASGLGIDVHDAHTSESRPTGTLSGGEKFCAALSLALGLAEVVQMEADGKSLESLFIDEGFGTLDARSLDQVMTVIDSLREGGRSVGLVSHVEELRTRIGAQIQVTGARHGSTLTVTTG